MLQEKFSVFLCLLWHLFRAPVFPLLVQIKFFLQFLLLFIHLNQIQKGKQRISDKIETGLESTAWHLRKHLSYCIIYLVILLKITTFPRDNMNVNMRYCLSCLGPILKCRKISKPKWVKILKQNEFNAKQLVKEMVKWTYFTSILLGWPKWVMKPCGSSQAACRLFVQWAINQKSPQQLDQENA